ncbi:MAG: UDP-N-acetylmuramate--L-alanine ligase [Phycisphaeraceae bacterium]
MRELDPTSAAGLWPDSTKPLELACKRLHFVGIGGCGMSGLARMAAKQGANCSGTDMNQSQTVATLREAGIDVSLDQSGAALPGAEELDMLVISAAIKPTHPEVVEATRRGAQVVKYAQLLGRLMVGRVGVAIAGTHGKSTTTSILSHILIQTGLDPSFIVGAHCEQIGGGVRVSEKRGPDEVLVAEACEYDRSFHNFYPTHATILNVEADHLDLYCSIDEIVEAFKVFAKRVPPEGSILIQHESPHRLEICSGINADVETVGFMPQADWRVGVRMGNVRLHYKDKPVCEWANPMPGDHFAYNAAVAAITARRLGAPWDGIGKAIAGFAGLDRRMQTLGQRSIPGGSVTVIDDYGHHPTEIDTTLRALAQHHDPKRLICVFQPHQHSRTRHLMEQFATSFSEADIVIVPEIYFVRDSEQERQAVTSGHLVDRLRKQGVTAMHLHPFEAIVEQLELITQPGDLVVTMGAGDVWKIGKAYLGEAI